MGRADLEHLTEGQRLDGVDLTLAEAAALNRTGLVHVQPDVHGWSVTAAHTVGAVRRGGLVVRVSPKVGVVQVLSLLARAHGVRGLALDAEVLGVAPTVDLSSVLAVLFAQEATSAMAIGPLRGYRTEDQTLPVLRGRVRVREQHLRRFGLPVPIEVTVDEWTLDTDENRRLLAATDVLLLQPDLPLTARRGLLRLGRLLSGVRRPPPGAPLAPWTPSRLNVRLHRLLRLADLALTHVSVEHEVGATQTHGFTVDMAWLFEVLVGRLLGEHLGGLVIQETFRLDPLGRLRIKPDLVVHDRGRVVAVADTKYKLLDDSGAFPNADAYQLVTYCGRLGLWTGHLIYAAGEPRPVPYEITGTGVELVLHAVDLTRPLDEIEAHVAALASLMGAAAAAAPATR